ncbi:eukaryotic nuclear protein implicated in meiotic chromosome segregation [Schizosaccharomyces japonicus yFS275]|uniref:Eukaryotic nuclear protein implicated in meiotic chromosome segregation n=1 Tax=Schizosaccharomyces japonicus (strain yFS275 / FY16936) TaxID=402676 RepID=B6JY02_SCHJY|nr:eukaryotic nuclear protein implicated in meiotic chromosome segregation [Schizosaccharomyces japonicus yFS275]EEB06420.1 eukaryotic nuclear protein implicated in meiotic chromosome segregation [Schizosaccharomyces japonicus yFS275]
MNQDDFRKLLQTPRNAESELSKLKAPSRPAVDMFGIRRKPRLNLFQPPRSVLQKKRPSTASEEEKGTKQTTKQRKKLETLSKETDAELTAEDDEYSVRIQELKQLVREGKITNQEYSEKTKELGGNMETTHLVRGLDRKLLARMKQSSLPNIAEKTNGDNETAEKESVNTEDEDVLLEQLASEKPHEESPSTSFSTGKPTQHRPRKEKRIPVYPNGAPMYEIHYENDTKVKILLDENGNATKRLVKKKKHKDIVKPADVLASSHEEQQTKQKQDTVEERIPACPPRVLPLPQANLDADIFDEESDYDPFGDREGEGADTKKPQLDLKKEKLFAESVNDEEISKLDAQQANAKSQIRRLAHLQERREAEEAMEQQEKRQVDAGFGLKLGRDDAPSATDMLDYEEDDDEDDVGKRKRR